MSRISKGVLRILALVLCLNSVPTIAADQILTPDGLGPVKIGMTVPEAEKALETWLTRYDPTDGWSSDACWYAYRRGRDDPGIRYMVRFGKIVRIEIFDPAFGLPEPIVVPVASEKGIRIRTPDNEIKRAYGASVAVVAFSEPINNDHYWTVLATGGQKGIRFETIGGKVTSFWAGPLEAIELADGCRSWPPQPESPAPSPSPVSNVASAPPAAKAADQILTPDGLGPVRIGMTVAQAEKALGAKLSPRDKSDDYSTEACWETQRLDDPDPAIFYMVRRGKIVRIDVTRYEQKERWEQSPLIASEKGIHIGDRDYKVEDAYGENVSISAHPFGGEETGDRYMTVLTGSKRRGILFEAMDGRIARMRAGLAKAIKTAEGCGSPAASTYAAYQVLRPDGLGPVHIGMTVRQAEEALHIKLSPFDPTYGDSKESCWHTYRLGETDPGVVYMVWYGRIVRVEVDGDDKTQITTDKGIRIGDSDAHVKEVYGPSLKVEVDPQANTEEEGSDLTAFTKSKRRGITYETFDRKVVNFRAGLPKATLLSEGCS